MPCNHRTSLRVCKETANVYLLGLHTIKIWTFSLQDAIFFKPFSQCKKEKKKSFVYKLSFISVIIWQEKKQYNQVLCKQRLSEKM